MPQGKAEGKILDEKTANSSRFFLWIVISLISEIFFHLNASVEKALKLHLSIRSTQSSSFFIEAAGWRRGFVFTWGGKWWLQLVFSCFHSARFQMLSPYNKRMGNTQVFWGETTSEPRMAVWGHVTDHSTAQLERNEVGKEKSPPSQTFWSRRKNRINIASYKYLTGPWPEQQGPHLCSTLLATRVNSTNFCFPAPVPQHQGRPQVWPIPSHHRVACVLFICWALCKALTRNH